jgi:peptidyl-prolyl cis-trans isomerase C
MKKKILYVGCLTGLLAASGLIAQETQTTPKDDPPPETTIATINSEEFSLGLFRLFFVERLRQEKTENTPAFQNQVFNEFVNIVVTAQNATSKGIDKDPTVQNAIKLQELQVLSRLDLQDAARNLAPSDEDLQKTYDDRYGNTKRKEFKARHILVKTEDEAKALIEKLDGGGDFTELAKESSLGPTGKNGGDLGWFDSKQMVKPFTEAVEGMKPGSYSETPVQTQFGWHVILLEDTREADPPSLDSVKGELNAGIQREALANYVSDLRKNAEVDLNSDLIKATKTDAEE